jgi:hypothetical protein
MHLLHSQILYLNNLFLPLLSPVFPYHPTGGIPFTAKEDAKRAKCIVWSSVLALVFTLAATIFCWGTITDYLGLGGPSASEVGYYVADAVITAVILALGSSALSSILLYFSMYGQILIMIMAIVIITCGICGAKDKSSGKCCLCTTVVCSAISGVMAIVIVVVSSAGSAEASRDLEKMMQAPTSVQCSPSTMTYTQYQDCM